MFFLRKRKYVKIMNKMINYIMSKSYSNFILELNRGKSIWDIYK